MKFLAILAVTLAVAAADVAHLHQDAAAAVLRSESDISPEGNFRYVYETANGIVSQAEGVVKGAGEAAALEVKGSVRYVSPDGTPVEYTYIANENGFQPQGAHIPQVPDYIVRSLEYIRTHAPRDAERTVVTNTKNTFGRF